MVVLIIMWVMSQGSQVNIHMQEFSNFDACLRAGHMIDSMEKEFNHRSLIYRCVEK